MKQKILLFIVFLFISISNSYAQQKFDILDMKTLEPKSISLDEYFFSEKLFTKGLVYSTPRSLLYNAKIFKYIEYEFDTGNIGGYYATYNDLKFEAVGFLADYKDTEVILVGALKAGFTEEELISFMHSLSYDYDTPPYVTQEKNGIRYLLTIGDKVINVLFMDLKVVQVDFRNNLNKFYGLGQLINEERISIAYRQMYEVDDKELLCFMYVTTKKYHDIFRKHKAAGDLLSEYSYDHTLYKVK